MNYEYVIFSSIQKKKENVILGAYNEVEKATNKDVKKERAREDSLDVAETRRYEM